MAYEMSSHKLVVVRVMRDVPETVEFDSSAFSAAGDMLQMIATTTVPGDSTPDWKQQSETLEIKRRASRKLVTSNLHPKSEYTFVVEGAQR